MRAAHGPRRWPYSLREADPEATATARSGPTLGWGLPASYLLPTLLPKMSPPLQLAALTLVPVTIALPRATTVCLLGNPSSFLTRC